MRRPKKINPLMPADGKCRYCGKKLPVDRRYYCPFDERADKIATETGGVYKTCSERFAEEYESPWEGETIPEPEQLAPLYAVPDQILAEAVAFAEWAADTNEHKLNPACRGCEHECKVWEPVPETPTNIICQKTNPELFE